MAQNPATTLKTLQYIYIWRRVPLTSAHGLPDHQTSAGNTRRHRASVADHSALANSAVSVRERYTQQDERGAADAADVREEVSADLAATPLTRPAACKTVLGRAEAPCPLP